MEDNYGCILPAAGNFAISNASVEQLREHPDSGFPQSCRMPAVILSSPGALSRFRRLTASSLTLEVLWEEVDLFPYSEHQ